MLLHSALLDNGFWLSLWKGYQNSFSTVSGFAAAVESPIDCTVWPRTSFSHPLAGSLQQPGRDRPTFVQFYHIFFDLAVKYCIFFDERAFSTFYHSARYQTFHVCGSSEWYLQDEKFGVLFWDYFNNIEYINCCRRRTSYVELVNCRGCSFSVICNFKIITKILSKIE